MLKSTKGRPWSHARQSFISVPNTDTQPFQQRGSSGGRACLSGADLGISCERQEKAVCLYQDSHYNGKLRNEWWWGLKIWLPWEAHNRNLHWVLLSGMSLGINNSGFPDKESGHLFALSCRNAPVDHSSKTTYKRMSTAEQYWGYKDEYGLCIHT